ncbi:hypothetical protein DT73_11650 [Mangrovibacter sp. MFB070]|nr:hypothetical protein DT73_11650 [Mangrovibacter sp. MFB070]
MLFFWVALIFNWDNSPEDADHLSDSIDHSIKVDVLHRNYISPQPEILSEIQPTGTQHCRHTRAMITLAKSPLAHINEAGSQRAKISNRNQHVAGHSPVHG